MSNRLPLAIYGAGGLGRELSAWIRHQPGYTFIGFIDDFVSAQASVGRDTVLGGLDAVSRLAGDGVLNVVVAIGDPVVKAEICADLSKYPVLFPTIIHPSVIMDDCDSIAIGEGTVITAGCVLTTDIVLGRHVLLNLNATVGHDTQIGDFSSVMPGAQISGQVTIGERVLIGTGSCLLNEVSIGMESRIGAGAVVTHDIPAHCTAVGIPAKPVTSS
jgi:sugar O-acyltransferase (sialic acid O-acetyltransferase NeuD family)